MYFFCCRWNKHRNYKWKENWKTHNVEIRNIVLTNGLKKKLEGKIENTLREIKMKTKYLQIYDVKLVWYWKFLDAKVYIKKEEKPQINNLSVYLKVLKNKKGKLNPVPTLG